VKRRAGLDDLHFHDLRHEALSRVFEMGLTTPEAASISGHRDPRMLFRYSHTMRQRMLEVIDRASP
jgi:integrase